jgi:rod shape-determining protein MreC
MPQLLRLLNRAKYFFLFIFLELICFFLIRRNNLHWDVKVFNSSNAITSRMMTFTANIKEYFHLKSENESLAEENAMLQKRLTLLAEASQNPSASFYRPDSAFARRFDFTLAKVIGSTISRSRNYITIDKGLKDGLAPGMGVIGPKGVVGQVRSCSDHFSVVFSILHEEFKVSSEVVNPQLRETGQMALGLSTWENRSHRLVRLNTIDKFKPVTKGDSVITSSQNLVFPPGILIGKVYNVETPSNGAFHNIDVLLSTDFSGLTYVYVVNNKLRQEQIRLEEGAAND